MGACTKAALAPHAAATAHRLPLTEPRRRHRPSPADAAAALTTRHREPINVLSICYTRGRTRLHHSRHRDAPPASGSDLFSFALTVDGEPEPELVAFEPELDDDRPSFAMCTASSPLQARWIGAKCRPP